MALFFGEAEHIPNRKIPGFLVIQSGIAIPEPTLMSQGKWNASCVVTGHFIAAIGGHVEFRSRDHAQLLTDDRAEIQ